MKDDFSCRLFHDIIFSRAFHLVLFRRRWDDIRQEHGRVPSPPHDRDTEHGGDRSSLLAPNLTKKKLSVKGCITYVVC